jgi:hypothetical protein
MRCVFETDEFAVTIKESASSSQSMTLTILPKFESVRASINKFKVF